MESEVNKRPDAKGFIFDGFPRTIPQAEALERLLDSKNTNISLMLALDVSEDELTKRLLLRGKDSGRSDDQDEDIVRNRIKVYNDQTSVVADFYTKQDKFESVDGIGDINEIFNEICEVVNKY